MLLQWTGECEPDGLANGVRIEDASVRGTERIEEKVMSGPRIVFCSNNHIYDASLYDACPYCSKIEAEQKELVSQAALEMPDHAAAKGPEGFADENSLSGNFAGQPGSGFGREPADFMGKESMPEDPYGVTVIGTGPAPAGHGDPFGAETPDQNVSDAGNLNNSAGNSGSYDKTVSSTGGLSGSEKKSPGTISDSSAEIDGMADAVVSVCHLTEVIEDNRVLVVVCVEHPLHLIDKHVGVRQVEAEHRHVVGCERVLERLKLLIMDGLE